MLLQYWGARAGVLRVLLVVAASNLTTLTGIVRIDDLALLAAALGSVLGFTVVMLALFGTMVVITMRTMRTLPGNIPSPATW